MKKRILIMLIGVMAGTMALAQQKNNTEPTIKNYTFYENDTSIIINWTTDGSLPTNYWKVQRSTDKVQFSTIALVLGNDPAQQGDAYCYKQKLKAAKHIKYYYRLCHVGINGTEKITTILTPAK